MWHVSTEWRMPHASRPWQSIYAGNAQTEQVHTGDCQAAVDICLSCKRANCPGDCAERARATQSVSVSREKKGVDPARVAELRKSGMSLDDIAEELGITRSSVKYWVRKLGVQAPKKQKAERRVEVPKSDPCRACRNVYLCKLHRWTCSDKARWEGACGSR